MKFAILTFGCRVNQADSFDLETDLRSAGGEETPVEEADVVLVNTCSVTATAERAGRQAIRRVARVNPHARVVATGCHVVRRPSDFATLPVAQLVARRDLAPSMVAFETNRALPPPGTHGRTLYLLRVQTGCDERCTYCVVPSTRGRSCSLPIAEVNRRVMTAAAAGFKELVMTGVHLGSWGRDLAPAQDLAALIRALAANPASVGFRLSSLEPMNAGPVLIETLAAAGRFAHQFHLPLQHASDRILATMGRRGTLDLFRRVVDCVRDRFPDAAIGTDLIVGFPGETPTDFDACTRFLASSPLTSAHVFPFSPRPGTAAASLAGRPPGAEVRRRVAELRAIGADLGRRFRTRFIGTTHDGLTIDDGSLVLTRNGLRVSVPPGLGRNQRVKVRILTDGDPMMGELVL